MSPTAYRLLGFAVWHGAKWYLRGRLPSRRAILGAGATAAAGAGAIALLARRAAA
jgi:hypothetical protein